MVVVNSGPADVSGWTGSLTTRDTLTAWWGMTAGSARGSTVYTLKPASYNVTIPAGGRISFGFNGNSG